MSDFEYEFQMVGMNRVLDNKIETVFLMADAGCQAIASRLVKEIAKLGGNIDKFVTEDIALAINSKFEESKRGLGWHKIKKKHLKRVQKRILF